MSLIKLAFFISIICYLPVSTVNAETSPYFPIYRDPFKRPTVSEVRQSSTTIEDEAKNIAATVISGATKLKLKAVLLIGDDPMANINGKILAIGDEIEEYRILKIMSDQVVLLKKKVTIEIQLNKGSERNNL